MRFKRGDIIEYCGEFFEVEENFGASGTVWILDDKFERAGERATNFQWPAYEECKLIKSADNDGDEVMVIRQLYQLLDWVTTNYEDVLIGKTVHDANECLMASRRLLEKVHDKYIKR